MLSDFFQKEKYFQKKNQKSSVWGRKKILFLIKLKSQSDSINRRIVIKSFTGMNDSNGFNFNEIFSSKGNYESGFHLPLTQCIK